MIEELKKISNEKTLVILPNGDNDIKGSLTNTLGKAIIINNEKENEEIITNINNSKISKLYLVGYHDIYRYILPRIKKHIEICWIFRNSFSELSYGGVRYVLHCILEYFDRDLIKSIGCIDKDNLKVLENAGYNCEYIDLKVKSKNKNIKYKNTIGIISKDYDPNNNFYNQLAALKFIEYDYAKFDYVMGATYHFIDFFELKVKKEVDIDKILSNNVVNLYINFTNTNYELVQKSFNYGVPCILGNTNIFDNNAYLKKHLVIKSDDDINEIVEKINFVINNREKLLKEAQKIFN